MLCKAKTLDCRISETENKFEFELRVYFSYFLLKEINHLIRFSRFVDQIESVILSDRLFLCRMQTYVVCELH